MCILNAQTTPRCRIRVARSLTKIFTLNAYNYRYLILLLAADSRKYAPVAKPAGSIVV